MQNLNDTARSGIGPSGPKTAIWPEGRIPDFQPGQIAATTEEVALPGFVPAENRMPYLQWYAPPRPLFGDKAPCAMIVSGGAYNDCCDGPAFEPLVAKLLEAGIHCVTFVYRTPRPAGLPIWRTGWEDGQRAVRLVRAAARGRGFDPDNIGAMACSAGSHLSLLLALRSQTPAYEPVDAADSVSARLSWLIAMCPAYLLSDGLAGRNANGGEGASLDPLFDPDAATPPVCFLHGSADPYSPLGSTALWRVLARKAAGAELHLDAGRGHGPVTAEPFARDAIGFVRRIGALPGTPPSPPPAGSPGDDLRAVEAWEAARRSGTERDLHVPVRLARQ